MSSGPRAQSAAGFVLAYRRLAWRHPEWWAVLLWLAAWMALAGLASGDAPDAAALAHHGHAPALAATPADNLHAPIATIAMMLPMSLGSVRRVSLASVWARHHRAMAVLLLAYLAVWLAVASVMTVTTSTLSALVGAPTTVLVVFALALTWQRTERKRRALRQCDPTIAPRGSGWRADRECAGLGIGLSLRCVTTCWPLMLLATALDHLPAITLGLSVLMLAERHGLRFLRAAATDALADLRFALGPRRVRTRQVASDARSG